MISLYCWSFVPDSSPVPPSLFVLRPLVPDAQSGSSADKPGPDVCLATRFRPKEGSMVLSLHNTSDTVTVSTSSAVMSTQQKTYFFAGFSDRSVESCELHGEKSEKESEKVQCETKTHVDPGSAQGKNHTNNSFFVFQYAVIHYKHKYSHKERNTDSLKDENTFSLFQPERVFFLLLNMFLFPEGETCADIHPGESLNTPESVTRSRWCIDLTDLSLFCREIPAEPLSAADERSPGGVHQNSGLQHHPHHQSGALLSSSFPPQPHDGPHSGS